MIEEAFNKPTSAAMREASVGALMADLAKAEGHVQGWPSPTGGLNGIILDALNDVPQKTAWVSERAGVGLVTTRHRLRAMHKAGVVAKCPGEGRATEMWCLP